MTKFSLNHEARFAKDGKLHAKNGHVVLDGETVGRYTFHGNGRFAFDTFSFSMESFVLQLENEPDTMQIINILETHAV